MAVITKWVTLDAAHLAPASAAGISFALRKQMYQIIDF